MSKKLLYEESFMKDPIKTPLRRKLSALDTVNMTQVFKFLCELSGTNHVPST